MDNYSFWASLTFLCLSQTVVGSTSLTLKQANPKPKHYVDFKKISYGMRRKDQCRFTWNVKLLIESRICQRKVDGTIDFIARHRLGVLFTECFGNCQQIAAVRLLIRSHLRTDVEFPTFKLALDVLGGQIVGTGLECGIATDCVP